MQKIPLFTLFYNSVQAIIKNIKEIDMANIITVKCGRCEGSGNVEIRREGFLESFFSDSFYTAICKGCEGSGAVLVYPGVDGIPLKCGRCRGSGNRDDDLCRGCRGCGWSGRVE